MEACAEGAENKTRIARPQSDLLSLATNWGFFTPDIFVDKSFITLVNRKPYSMLRGEVKSMKSNLMWVY